MTANPVNKRAAELRGKARTEAVQEKVAKAMAIIKQEMAANEGIYPANGGAVSMNEVARRAGIHETTLFAPKQVELRKKVKDWVDTLKKSDVVGRGRVQRKLSERVADWKQRFEDLTSQQIEVELELQTALSENEMMQKNFEELQAKYDALLEQLRSSAASKVMPFPKGKR